MASDDRVGSGSSRELADYRRFLASSSLRVSQGRASSDTAHLSFNEAQSGSGRPHDEHETKNEAAITKDKTSALHGQGLIVAERESAISYFRNITQPNWHMVLCTLLKISPESPVENVFQAAAKAEESLREVEHLRKLVDKKQELPRPEVIYVVHCHDGHSIHYHDEPRIVGSGPNQDHRQGNTPVRNLELFLERHKEVTFLVYRTLECCKKGQTHKNDSAESISIMNPILRSALITMAENALHDIPHPIPSPEDEEEEEEMEVHYPYLWWYFRQGNIRDTVKNLPGEQQRHMKAFADYLDKRMKTEWRTAEELMEQGRITAKYTRYLFKPGNVVVTGPDSGPNVELRAYEVKDWLEVKNSHTSLAQDTRLALSHWIFDGNFQRTDTARTVINPLLKTLNQSHADEEFPITSLSLYPLEFASEEVYETLKRRGKMFWKCRKRNYVSYRSVAKDHPSSVDQRFMVDMATYKTLHPPDPERERRPYRDDLEPGMMSQDNPQLEDRFCMTLPSEIVGFNMQTKEWVMLVVDQIEDVIWNSAAFGEYLVINPPTKQLIQAVVTEHLRTEESADVISGKGNGLFILLHGAPGTGKTLTAESVAEVAKKPLFRVTCGDIGTKPEEVEEYLNTVFTLGRTWDCVVLLDEADIYLEQRSSTNLERNALVSVFLRALEYYDGIMILTSNRVGTFDEAFRSRIQLSLKYNKLDEGQRQQIWKNFVKRLDGQNNNLTAPLGPHSAIGPAAIGAKPRVGANIDDISKHITDLAKRELNGRQIRNIISTARKLATYLEQQLCYEHLQTVMEETDKFEKYIVDLHRGLTDDDVKYSNQERGP